MSEHGSTPRTGALRPEHESELDQVARGAAADVVGDEVETPAPGPVAPSAGEGAPGRMTADHKDADEDPSYPTLRGGTAAEEVGRP